MLLLSVVAGIDRTAVMHAPNAAPCACRVVAAEKLPSPLGQETICAAVARAMAAHAPRAKYSLEVRVISKSRLKAILVVKGHELPAENIAVSDGELGLGSIERLADRLAVLAAAR
jgi:hypothetical protein